MYPQQVYLLSQHRGSYFSWAASCGVYSCYVPFLLANGTFQFRFLELASGGKVISSTPETSDVVTSPACVISSPGVAS